MTVMGNIELNLLPNPCHQESMSRQEIARMILDDPATWGTYLQFMKRYSGLPYRSGQPEVGHLAGKPSIDVISAITADGRQFMHIRRDNSGRMQADNRLLYYAVTQDIKGPEAPVELEIIAASISQLFMRKPGENGDQMVLDMGDSFRLWRSTDESITGFHSFYDLNNAIYELGQFNVELPDDELRARDLGDIALSA